MRLTAKERNRLTIFTLAELARRRRDRGRKLNAPEAVAVICDEILEMAWDGLPLREVVARAETVLGRQDVMEGVQEIVGRIEIDALFPSGTALVVVEYPFGPALARDDRDVPGQVIPGTEPVLINAGRTPLAVIVENQSSTPIEVTSHFHFSEANRSLNFDRRAALGRRLDIPAGTAVRWEPHERKEVSLIPLGGNREVWGFGGLVDGPLDEVDIDETVASAIRRGYAHEEQSDAR
ncbi:MAG: urease subunit beta [Acidimicrobiia bacterium]|nr:urease subunit beta [Acidimicrobiia bacterium]